MMTSHPRFIGFYSYKGGVGRSLALANTAVMLARQGRSILIVDLDLEAPGQHHMELFADQFGVTGGRPIGPPRGFLEMAQDFAEAKKDELKLEDYSFLSDKWISVANSQSLQDAGSIRLLAAGNLANMDLFRQQLTQFSWEDWVNECGGMGFFAHLRAECSRLKITDILFDSRTGLSDPFYLIALELADTFVIVSAYNQQNLAGTRLVCDTIASYPEARRPRHLVLALSPRPADTSDRDFWEHRFPTQLGEWFTLENTIEIPYEISLVYQETIITLSNKAGRPYYKAIKKLTAQIDQKGKPFEKKISAQLSTNPIDIIRADYANIDTLLQYFVDPGEGVTDVMRSFMPVMIYGNRGTGKTILAKNYDYHTTLARLSGKPPIPVDMPLQTGLYLRFDLDLLNSFNTRDLERRPIYNQLFANFFDVMVVRKALDALHRFGGTDGLSAWCDPADLFAQLYREFGVLESTPEMRTFAGFERFIGAYFSNIRRYINNPTLEAPLLLQGNILMKLLVDVLLSDSRQVFGERWFMVMVDEVEHFEIYQQKVLNSRLKQIKQGDRVSYRYLLRHEGLRTKETTKVGQDIQETHDFRTYRLDEGLTVELFKTHAQKVTLRQLERTPFFQDLQLKDLTPLFATITAEEEALRVIDKSSREDQLARQLTKLHEKAPLPPLFFEWFENENAILRKALSLILLYQGKQADAIVSAMTRWDDQAKDWYHNYHRAALHWLLSLYGRPKIYAGLNQIALLSGYNVRYFLEYCRAIIEEWRIVNEESQVFELPIPVEIQTRAILKRAEFYRDDLRGKPRYAEQLFNLVNRLGRIFEAAHRSPRQSQYEINQFSIAGLNPAAEDELSRQVREARMENVLLRRPSNKQKSLADERGDDWHLHPCYAPLFNISTRDKKKLESLTKGDLAVVFNGEPDAWKLLFAKCQKQFESTDAEDDLQWRKQNFLPLFPDE